MGSEIWECVDMEAAESLFSCLEQVPDPRRARGVRHPFQAILRLTLLGLVCGQTTMAHIALFARMHWPVLREPLGFLRDHPPHATTTSRTLAGVPYEQLRVDSGRGQNRTLSPLPWLWPSVFASEQAVGPPKGVRCGPRARARPSGRRVFAV